MTGAYFFGLKNKYKELIVGKKNQLEIQILLLSLVFCYYRQYTYFNTNITVINQTIPPSDKSSAAKNGFGGWR